MKESLLVALVFALLGITADLKDVQSQGQHVTQAQFPKIIGSGAPRPGEWIRFDLVSLGDRGATYQAATSLGTGPVRIGVHRLPLSFDPVFFLSASGRLPQVFQNYAGRLDMSGRAQVRLHIPRCRELVGLRIHTAFVTVRTTAFPALQSVSPAYTLTVTR